jgi:hypothetical protein
MGLKLDESDGKKLKAHPAASINRRFPAPVDEGILENHRLAGAERRRMRSTYALKLDWPRTHSDWKPRSVPAGVSVTCGRCYRQAFQIGKQRSRIG